MNHIQGLSREQMVLFPEAIEDYVAADNPVRFLDAFVENLSLIELGFQSALLQQTGRPPYHPADLLKLYLYGYLHKLRSSRKLEVESQRNVELMWLMKKLSPSLPLPPTSLPHLSLSLTSLLPSTAIFKGHFQRQRLRPQEPRNAHQGATEPF